MIVPLPPSLPPFGPHIPRNASDAFLKAVARIYGTFALVFGGMCLWFGYDWWRTFGEWGFGTGLLLPALAAIIVGVYLWKLSFSPDCGGRQK